MSLELLAKEFPKADEATLIKAESMLGKGAVSLPRELFLKAVRVVMNSLLKEKEANKTPQIEQKEAVYEQPTWMDDRSRNQLLTYVDLYGERHITVNAWNKLIHGILREQWERS